MLFGIISVVVTLILVATQKYLSRKRKMSGVVLLLIGTGCLASIIYNSAIKDLVVAAIEYLAARLYTCTIVRSFARSSDSFPYDYLCEDSLRTALAYGNLRKRMFSLVWAVRPFLAVLHGFLQSQCH